MKKNITFAGIAASALAALTIGLAAPAAATPSGNGHDPVNVTVTAPAPAYPINSGQTPYGTYQNTHKR